MLGKIRSKLAISKIKAKESEFMPAVVEVLEKPPVPASRIILWGLVFLIVVGILWSIFGTVNEVAVATGKIIPEGYVKSITAKSQGVVSDVLVKEGDFVIKGQVLFKFDEAFSLADLNRLQKQEEWLKLDLARLAAELNNKSFSPLAKDYKKLNTTDIEAEKKLFETRRASYKANLAAARAMVLQNQAALQSAVAGYDKYRALYLVEKDKEDRMEELYKSNAVAYFAVLNQRSSRVEMEQNMISQKAEIEKQRAAIAQSQQALADVEAQRASEISQKMTEDSQNYGITKEDLTKAEEQYAYAELVAPNDGRVTGLAVHNAGEVVAAGQQLCSVVPEGAQLMVEAWLSNKDIGYIHPGQEAVVKVDTYNFQKFGMIQGVVESVSPDAIEDKDRGPIYRVMVALKSDYLTSGNGIFYIGPGMSCTTEIKTRKKRIIEFFLDPFKKYQSESLQER